ncbi:MAG: Holliday junction resolvase RuvX [Planctomycetota bacterium]
MTTDSSPPAAVIPAGRVAGVDYGRKRIGVAVCDAHRILASPLCVRQTTGDKAADATFFRKLIHDEAIIGFVVGLPIHADGNDSKMSVEVERFGAWLESETGLTVVFHDERYSSREATGLLAGSGLSRGRKKERSDAIAAQVVLSSWMEAQAHGGGLRPGALDG